MSVTNTAKSPRPEWLFGQNPDAILAQEAAGQKEMCESSQLPKESSFGKSSKELLEKLGIQIIKESENDDLFYDVILPKGWEIKPTDHPMWTELVDDNGKAVAQIFYKAAFYDRNAHIRIKE